MGESPLILGVSGLRGIVGESLTPEVAAKYAAAFGEWLLEENEMARKIIVVRDGRAGGEDIYRAAIDGVASCGLDVMACDVAMTPTAGVAVRGDVNGAIVVTASHNPGEWNGLKCLIPAGNGMSGQAPSKDDADAIIAAFRQIELHQKPATGLGKIKENNPMAVTTEHCDRVIEYGERFLGGVQADGLLVVLDSVNASGAVGAGMLLKRLGVEYQQLFGDGSGIFPHTPEPTKENLSGEGGLCSVVPGVKASVGFAQDPDADRLAVVDENGEYIGEEYTLVLCAAALMEARKEQQSRKAAEQQIRGGVGEKPVFVVNLSTSRMIDDVAKNYGGEVVRTAVGEANVVEAMKALKTSGRDVVLGGEGNGGVIWPEVTYVRDSLSGMALILSLMARTGKTVSELVKMIEAMGPGGNGYCIVKEKAALASKADAVPVVEHLRSVYEGQAGCRVDLQDGIRVDWDEQGVWAHVRASNTEAIMRVIVEAPSEELARETAQAVNAQIQKVRG